jgi:hypothetical protein
MMSRAGLWIVLSAGAGLVAGGAYVPVAGQTTRAPEPAGQCTEGVITSIELDRKDVFDPDATSVGALAWTYRALNVLHVRTVPRFIRSELLFAEGDCFDPFLVVESERLLDAYGFLAKAQITAKDDGNGGKAVLIETQDEWSTQVDVGVTYDDANLNLEKLEVTEKNFLGLGIFAEFTHRERRETRAQSVGLATPRFFGRADASIRWGRDRPGQIFDQFVRYPFIGETGRFSIRQGYARGTRFFAYSTDGQEVYSQVLVPSFRELMEVSAAQRFGERGRSIIAGITLTRDVIRFPDVPRVTIDDNFNDLQPFPGELPPLLADHLQESGATRVALHVGTRRYRYMEYEGLDGLRDRMVLGLGFFVGATMGKGFALLVPDDVPGLDDYFGRLHGSFTFPIGSSLLHGGTTVETRRDRGDWQDLLVDGDLVAYLRTTHLKSHTLFLRASGAGGWRTSLPFQLSLGGREGIRSLPEDRLPGGRMTRFVVEDRILFPWPAPGSADLGLTLFADLGRVWQGDVPYAVDSGWQAALGFGLRIGLPAGTRNIWRTDIAFPVGPTGGSPIFRVTFEFNRLRAGFFTPDVFRSRRYNLGAEHF